MRSIGAPLSWVAAAGYFLVLHATVASADDWSDCTLDQGSDDAVISACARALTRRDLNEMSRATAYNSRAFAHVGKKDFTRALADYTLAIEAEPSGPLHYSGRGEVYRLMKKFPEALADHDKAVTLSRSGSAAIYYRRGLPFEDMGQRESAIAEYRKAQEISRYFGPVMDALKRLGVPPR
jgi:tetratricopeptide (TPR) repeat protein